MTTHVTFSLIVGSNPTRNIEVNLPVENNRVAAFNQSASQHTKRYPLEDFIFCCENQAKAMTLICEENNSIMDCHIGGLMASVMSLFSVKTTVSPCVLDMNVDCFCYLLKADGFQDDEVEKMCPQIMHTIHELCAPQLKR